jgi:hypothetical protein
MDETKEAQGGMCPVVSESALRLLGALWAVWISLPWHPYFRRFRRCLGRTGIRNLA